MIEFRVLGFKFQVKTGNLKPETRNRRAPAPRTIQNLTWGTLVLSCTVLLLMGACGKDVRTPQGVAEAFIDQHYVRIDLQKAKDYAAGLALEKINQEIRLTAGQAIDASTRKPKIHYRLVEKKDGAERVSFLYEATIDIEDDPSLTRHWLITTRKEAGQWRVANFTEYD